MSSILEAISGFFTGKNDKQGLNAPTNAILVLHPYNYYGAWVFDDDRVGLVREPFVNGIPEILEDALADAGIPLDEAGEGFKLTFSANPFPTAGVELTLLRPEYGGNWYTAQSGKEGWLCPALFKYFQKAPKKIYCKVERSKGSSK
jgi:hypothetical protein